jgi:hypothetical protein
MEQSLRGYHAGLAALHVRFRTRLLIQTLAVVLVLGVAGSAHSDSYCGDGHVDAGEECDDGGICIGGSNAGTACTSESQCIGNGVCDGGTKSFYACANDSGCPGGLCRRCVPQGGDGCAVNCTGETEVPFDLVPGIIQGLGIKAGTSGEVNYGDILRIPLALEGTETLTIGKEYNGQIPMVIKTTSIRFPRLYVTDLECGCMRGVTAKTCGGTLFDIDEVTPSTECTDGFTAGASVCPADKPCAFLYGPGNAASGVVGCEGYSPVNVLWTQDSGGSSGMRGKPIITLSGTGGQGSALLLSSRALGTVFFCTGTDPTVYGPDGKFCTDDDPQPSRGTATTFLLTTGTATGAVMNANGTNGDNLGGPFSVSGAPFSCTNLAAGDAAGAAIVGAAVELDQPVLGDVVVTSAQVALEPPTPTPTPTPVICVGDCDGNGAVTIDELIAMVNIALGSAPVSTCPAAACLAGFEAPVDITCIISAVNYALSSCPMLPPTPTITPQPVGNPCFNSEQCLSGFCIDTVCCITASCPLGEYCNISDSRGVCAPRKDLGEPCLEDQDCVSGNCGPSGICQPPLTPTPQPTPTPSPLPTATLAPGQCRSWGDCPYHDYYFWCLEPGGFRGCGQCETPESTCSTDADCHGLGGSWVCTELGPPSRTCAPCYGPVFVCMQGCSADNECASGQACEQHRCVGSRCSNDQQCPALFRCAIVSDGGTSQCVRRSCTTDMDCGDGFCVESNFLDDRRGLCYSALGECTMPPQ